MLKKFTNKKGFTLMEMLIVVAIIAILVAIAIPTFSSALSKAKAATDAANIRAGYANLQIQLLVGEAEKPTTGTKDYYLQKDGSVKPATVTDGDYKCKANSTDYKEAENIAGLTGTDLTWTEGKSVVYTVNTDGKVTAIKAGS